ncbi:MAG: methyl-coenzyme M reductase family protein [Candidatus Methanomethylophilaceae archaeon]|nr:methyl-coenzyme M reductase family protein [Candidatus Methanomethylophilaceae archaeon]
MYEVLMYDGGVYRSDELYELIDDVGGVVINKSRSQQMLMVTMAIPGEEVPVLERFCHEIGGITKEVPLAGTEIAVVGPTLGRHHMPHPICDIAEQLRQLGAITVVMGLARGRGKERSQIMAEEKAIINEYDAAIFMLGNFKSCVESKKHLFDQIEKPVVLVTGAKPEGLDQDCEAIISGIGRKSERMRRPEERKKLDETAEATVQVVKDRRRVIEEDPLFVHPAEIKQLLEDIDAVSYNLRPAPIVLHLDGLRVKIPYKEHVKELEEIQIYGRRLGDVAEIKPSRISDSSTIIRILSRSEVEYKDQV